MTVFIYGANGYTGSLISRRAVQLGLSPILAGRRAEAVRALARELGLEARVCGLEEPESIARQLNGVSVVLNCAGPFRRTAPALLTACVRHGIHYLDLAGEASELADTFERLRHESNIGVTVLPGAGFDVVPSDCLAAVLKQRLPTATRLRLGFQIVGGVSRGTKLSSFDSLVTGGLIRKGGELVAVPNGWNTLDIDYGNGPVASISVPWGDLVTAHASTGIANIELYLALGLPGRLGMRAASLCKPLFASKTLRGWLARNSSAEAAGPNSSERARGSFRLWAEARDPAGRVQELRLKGPDAYELTSWTALELALRASRGELPRGLQTPSSACGPSFILEFPGVAFEEVKSAAIRAPIAETQKA